MLSTREFSEEILEPACTAFWMDPASLFKCTAAIWSVDSYASHVAWECFGRNPNAFSNRIEIEFKDEITDHRKSDQWWRFYLLRELSNALKHGTRKGSRALTRASNDADLDVFDGAAAYFQNSEFFATQWVVDLEKLDPGFNLLDERGSWKDSDGREFKGLLLSRIPVLDLFRPALTLIADTALRVAAHSLPSVSLPPFR